VKSYGAHSQTLQSQRSGNPGTGEILLYQTKDGKTRIDVRLEKETVWLSLNQMARLFGRDKSVISRHLHNVFKEKELEGSQLLQKMQQLPPTARFAR